MRPRIANAADKLRGKSDVYLASTFSPINNSTLRESSLFLPLSLSFSSIFAFLLYHTRRPTDESSGLTRALLPLSNRCPLFTRLRNSAWFYNTHPPVWSAHTRLFDLSIDRTDESSYDHCFSRNDHIPFPFPFTLGTCALDHCSRTFLSHFSWFAFLILTLVV